MTFHPEVFAPNRRESNQLTLRPTGFDPAPEKKKNLLHVLENKIKHKSRIGIF